MRVIVLEEGRMFRLTGDNVVLVDNQPVMIDTLQPGTQVVIRSAEPVMLQDGTSVVMAEPAPVVSEPAALPRSTVVAINPVVYRSGRYALLNEGFRDDSGSTLAPDADFAGYEADTDDAGMQVQGS
jgi:hypothetical protein